MSKAFDTINIHTLIKKLLQTKIPGTIIKSSSQTTSRGAKPTQHIEITHPHNVNSKLAFHKVASFHQHYYCCLPTPRALVSGGGVSVPDCGPPASFSSFHLLFHLASSAVTPTGFTHKPRGDNVVSMSVLQRGHSGDICD